MAASVSTKPQISVFLLLLLSLVALCLVLQKAESLDEQSLLPSESSRSTTIPAFPVQQQQDKQTCHLDLSDELFGGVKEACGTGTGPENGGVLDRSRCCPVLAAWLYAAHARSALSQKPDPQQSPASSSSISSANQSDPVFPSSSSSSSPESAMPMLPEDSQTCVSSLSKSLEDRGIKIQGPNSSCDVVMCFCGIRLHRISSLTCPNAFNISSPSISSNKTHNHKNNTSAATLVPLPAVKSLETHCKSPSYAGCTTCLNSLLKLKGKRPGIKGGRSEEMYKRDCEIMGLTWLLAKNKTAYIPTVSAVLRALMYTDSNSNSNSNNNHSQAVCSRDQDNMPLAVDSEELDEKTSSSSSSSSSSSLTSSASPFLSLKNMVMLFNIFCLLWMSQ